MISHHDLALRLAHELGCALEMTQSREELASPVWEDAIDGLDDTRHLLLEKGVAVPEVIDSVLRAARGEGVTAPG